MNKRRFNDIEIKVFSKLADKIPMHIRGIIGDIVAGVCFFGFIAAFAAVGHLLDMY